MTAARWWRRSKRLAPKRSSRESSHHGQYGNRGLKAVTNPKATTQIGDSMSFPEHKHTSNTLLNEIVRTHCLSRRLPIPEMTPQGGFALHEGGACAIHVSARGSLLELVTAAGRIPEVMLSPSSDVPVMHQLSLPPDPMTVKPEDTSAARNWMHERTEVDPQTRLLILRQWLLHEKVNEEIFSAAVDTMRRHAHLWRTLFNLEAP
jgi:hypothetical protein